MYLHWNESQHVEVKSVDELDGLVDWIAASCTQGLPVTVELASEHNLNLLIVVGGEASHVEFFSQTRQPPVVSCCGVWDMDDLIAFTYRRSYSEVPMRFCVPISKAQAALRQFFKKGTRPNNIKWNA